MKKSIFRKIVILGMAFIMLFSLTALAGCGEYRRHPKSDERIEAQLENQIRRDYASRNRRFRNIFISHYFGTYDDASAIIIRVESRRNNFHLPFVYRAEIAGIDFGYVSGWFITIWFDGVFYRFEEAFDQGLLTVDNVQSIRNEWEPYFRERL